MMASSMAGAKRAAGAAVLLITRTLSPCTQALRAHPQRAELSVKHPHALSAHTLTRRKQKPRARGRPVHRVAYADGDVKWHDLSAERVIINGALSTDPRSTIPSKQRAASPSQAGGAKTPKASPAKPRKASPAKAPSPA